MTPPSPLEKRIFDLREVAERATPGDWDARCREFSNTELPRNIWSEHGWVAKTENCDQVQNAAHIAAFSPAQAMKLLDALEEAVKALRKYKHQAAECDIKPGSESRFSAADEALAAIEKELL